MRLPATAAQLSQQRFTQLKKKLSRNGEKSDKIEYNKIINKTFHSLFLN